MDDQFSYSSSKVERLVLDELVAQSGLSQAEIACLLGVAETDLDQQVQDELPNLDQNHSQLVAGVLRHGLAVFDQRVPPLIKWLRTPHPELACPQTGFFPLCLPQPNDPWIRSQALNRLT